MNRYSQDSGSHGQQIVQAYAAKKAAQMERAKQIRLERERTKQNGGSQSPGTGATLYPSAPNATAHAGPHHTAHAHSFDTPQPVYEEPIQPSSGYSHAAYGAEQHQYSAQPQPQPSRQPARAVQRQPEPKYQAPPQAHDARPSSNASVASVLVGEADLAKAVQAGIITQDQCAKLWETFRLCGAPAEAHGHSKENTVPLTKPNAQYNSAAAKPAYGQPLPLPRAHKQEPVQGGGYEDRFDNLADQGRMAAQMQEAKQRNTKVAKPQPSGWNMETEVMYDEPESDEAFLARQRGPDKLPRKSSLQQKRGALPDWNSVAEDQLGGFGEPPKLPTRAAKKQPATRATPRSGMAQERATPRSAGGPQYGHEDVRGGGGGGFSSAVGNPQSAYRSQAQQPAPAPPVDDYSNYSDYNAPPPPPQGGAMDPDALVGGKSLEELQREAAAAAAEPQGQCYQCGRTFRQSVLARHQKTCGKGSKRRVFNASKQRELPDQNMVLKAQEPTKPAKESKWKQQHQAFQQAMKNNKLVAAVEKGEAPASALQSLPPPPDNRVPCPHCSRKFAPDVAERHIPKCKNIIAKPKACRTRF